MYTFAPPQVLVSLMSFRAIYTLGSVYNYFDVLGELNNDTLVRYQWTSTYAEHFYKENGDQPGVRRRWPERVSGSDLGRHPDGGSLHH